MAAPLLRGQRQAFAVIRLLLGVELRFDPIAFRGRGLGCLARERDRGLELRELALPCEHAVELTVGREKTDPLRADDVTFGGNERVARAKRTAIGERTIEIGAATHPGKPVAEHAREPRTHKLDLGQQRITAFAFAAARRRRIRGVRGDPAGQGSAIGPGKRSIELVDLERVEPLAKHRLQRIFPTAFDVQLLPQPPCAFEVPGREPFVGVLAAPDLRLQRGERGGACLAVRERPARLLPCVAGGALALLQRLNGVAQATERGLAPGEIGGFLLELLGDERNLLGKRRAQRRDFRIQSLAPLRQRRERLARILAARLGHPYRLLDVGQPLLNLGECADRGCDAGFGLRQGGQGGTLFLGCALASDDRRFQLALAFTRLGIERRDLSGEPRQQLADLRDLLRQAAFALAGELQLLLETCDFRVRGVERALLLVQVVARAVLRGTQRLDVILGRAKLRLHGFEGAGEVGDLGAVLLAQTHRILLLGEPEHVLRLLQARFEVAVLRGDLRLRLELGELRYQLVTDVLDPRQIDAGIGKPGFGLLAPFLVLRDPRRLFEEDAQLLRLRLDHAADHALLDDGVGARAQARAEEQVVDIATTDRNVVDVIRRVTVAAQHPLDRQLGVAAPLSTDPTLAVVEEELHRGTADRRALARAVEDDVLHRLAAQRGRLGLAQDPTHGIDDVRLAAAVGADDADELSGSSDAGRVDERLETGQLDLCEAQFGIFGTG